MNNYYVYIHFDPQSEEVLYVGMGTKARAYTMTSSKSSNIRYGHRAHEYSKHLQDLFEKGYLPHEWIKFEERGMSKEDALVREKELIKELSPKYNRPAGIKHLKFDIEGVKKMKDLRRQGLYYTEIAKQMECSPMVAHRIINDLSPRYVEMQN